MITAAVPPTLLLAVTLGPWPPDRPVQAFDSPLDLRALDGGLVVLYQAAFAVTIIALVVAAASLVGRFRHARGIERLQLRWLALATVLITLLGIAHLAAFALSAYDLASLAGGLSPPILSAAVGAAILRYRLYDLDRIISRTLAYALLTLLLAGGYALLALALGQLVGQDSSLAVAGATLAVAAVFQPARRRIQQTVDRRFNRRRHDATRIIEGFGARLHQQVDLDSLTVELLGAVDRSMQPTQASLWLRSPPEPPRTPNVP